MSDAPPAGMRLCPTCGRPVVPTDRFCVDCGSPLPDPMPLHEYQAAVIAPPKVPWRAWEGIVVVVLGFVLGAIVSVPGILLLDRNGGVAVTIIAGELTSLAVTVAWVKIRYGAGLKELGWRSRSVRTDAGVGLAAGLGGFLLQLPIEYFVFAIARLFLGHDPSAPKQVVFEGHPSAAVLFTTGVGVILLAPIAEETLFRGMVFQAFRRGRGARAAALLSAVVFGLSHVHPLLYLPIGALGFVLAWTFERRDSVYPGMVAHALFNTIGFIVIAGKL